MDTPQEPPDGALKAIAIEMKRPGSLALLFMATALTLVSNLSLPDVKILLIWPLTISVILISYIWLTCSVIRSLIASVKNISSEIAVLKNQPNLQLPKVVNAFVDPATDEGLILLLKPNQIFGQSMLVSVYYEDERDLELLVANGSVANVQMNGYIQIAIQSWQEAHLDVRRKVLDKNEGTITRLMVKPAANMTQVDGVDNAAILSYLMNRVGEGRQI